MRDKPPAPSPEAERLFTIAEIADLWGVSYDHVHRLIGAGRLRAVRSGRAWRVPASALAEYIEARAAERDERDGG